MRFSIYVRNFSGRIKAWRGLGALLLSALLSNGMSVLPMVSAIGPVAPAVRPMGSTVLPVEMKLLLAGSADGSLNARADTLSSTLPDRSVIEQELEEIFEDTDPEESGDGEGLMLRLEELSLNPLNINRAGVDELMQVPGLSGTLAHAIVVWKRDNRPFESVDELTLVRGIGPATLERIRPWLTTGTAADLRRDYYLNPAAWVHNHRTEVIARYRTPLDLADGYRMPDSLGGYRGGPAALYQRIHFRSNHLSAGLIRNKRSGEQIAGFAGPDAGPIHLALHEMGRLQTLVVGDYRVQFGQGLILGDGSTFGKGQDVIRSVNRGGAGIRGHTSTQTTHSFRGAAATWGKEWQVSAFWSARPRSATEADAGSIRFPALTPSYRTRSEWDRRYNTRQRTAGGRITRQLAGREPGSRSGQIGVGGWHNRFDRPVQPGNGEWQVHDPGGHHHWALSADWRVSHGPAQWFGESARSGNGGFGALTGVEVAAGNDTRMTLSYRHYGERLQAIFGDSFSEQSGAPRNEQGWYLGVRHRFSSRLQLHGYTDLFRFPGARFRTRQPSHRFDWLLAGVWRADRQTEFTFQMRQKVRGEEFSTVDIYGLPVRLLEPESRFSGRVQLSRQLQPGLRVRVRLEHVRTDPAGEQAARGWMGWGDLRVQPVQSLQIDLRLAHFRTDNFHSRIYMYENDLLYAFTSTMLYGQGQRIYLLTRYRPLPRLQLWLKTGVTLFRDRQGLGSGPAFIPGNRRSEVGLQARWLF